MCCLKYESELYENRGNEEAGNGKDRAGNGSDSKGTDS
jgi:hypothetical protein